jgi:hypothetical protein
VTTKKEAELERATRLRGFRYGLHDFLAALDLHALKAVNATTALGLRRGQGGQCWLS